MIIVKSERELSPMRRACRITGDTLKLCEEKIKPGITTKQLDKIAHDYIISQGAKPAFLGYNGFPAACCISLNEEVIHGIPGVRVIEEGDIVSVDTGAIYKGFYGDAARTFAAGDIEEADKKLIEVTKQSFFEGISAARDGVRLGDLGHAIQTYAEANGFSVVREYAGHGIGKDMHEDPMVYNYGELGRGIRLKAGMTIAVEPMVNAGGCGIKVLADGWTVVTADGKNSAHYENTVLVTADGAEILTL